jgi:hypothetical protein
MVINQYSGLIRKKNKLNKSLPQAEARSSQGASATANNDKRQRKWQDSTNELVVIRKQWLGSPTA